MLESDSLTPLYQQVIDDIRQDIENGTYQVGQKIPSESELSEMYRVSRITVRRAIEELSSLGYLTKKQGKGTYVNPRKIHSKILQVEACQSFGSMCEEAGRVPREHLIMREQGLPSKQEAQSLGIAEGEEVVAVRTLRTADDIPVMYSTIILSAKEFSFLMVEDLSDALLYDVFARHGARMPAGASETRMELIRADRDMAEILNVNVGEPLFDEHGVIVGADGKPLLIGHARIVASMYYFNL